MIIQISGRDLPNIRLQSLFSEVRAGGEGRVQILARAMTDTSTHAPPGRYTPFRRFVRLSDPDCRDAHAEPHARPATAVSHDFTASLETTRAREALLRRALASADMVALALALLAVTVGTGSHAPEPLLFLALPALLLCCKVSGLYDHDDLVLHRSTLDEIPRLVSLTAITALVFWLVTPEMLDTPLGRSELVLFAGVLLVAMAIGRWAARRATARITPPERCLVVGDACDFTRMRHATAHNGAVAWIGHVPIERVVTDLTELRRIASEHLAERLVIAPPNAIGMHEAAGNLIREAKATGLAVSVMPGPLEVVTSAVVFDQQPGVTLLGVKRFGLTRSSAAVKRTFDVVLASAALLVLAPFMAIVALAIKLETPGPVFFRQQRIGRDGKVFWIVKFRTMCDGADAMRSHLAHLNEVDGGLFKIASDPRVTRAGRYLRKTSLDELPQLINVMRGEMSLVGPRPLVTYEDARVTGLDRQRLDLTPGMTGPWQVAGGKRLPLPEMVKMDYLYVAGWSLWTDVKIILRTFTYVVRARGH